MIRKYGIITFVIATFFLIAGSSDATAETEPVDTVKQLLDAIRKCSEPSQLKTATEQANATLDISGLSRKSLGKHWKKMDEDAREQFIGLLRTVFEVKAYPESSNFFKKLNIQFRGEEVEDEKAIVHTRVKHSDEGLVDIDYKLRRLEEKGWIIYEVLMDDVPMAANLRTQIRKVLRKEGYDALVNRLKKKIAETKKKKQEKE